MVTCPPDRLAAPGLACFAWPCSNLVARLSTRVQQLDVSTDTKTKDNVTVRVNTSVQCAPTPSRPHP